MNAQDDRLDITNIPCIRCQNQYFLEGIDSLRIQSLGEVDICQLCP